MLVRVRGDGSAFSATNDRQPRGHRIGYALATADPNWCWLCKKVPWECTGTMETKLLLRSEAFLERNLCSPLMGQRGGGRISRKLCSFPVRDTSVSASHSAGRIPRRDIGVESREELFVNDLSRVIGKNGARTWSYSREGYILDAFEDEYGGIIVNSESLPWNANKFASALRASLSHWKLQGIKGVWLKLPLERSEFVPIAVKEGFRYHHAEEEYVMLTYWIPEGPSMLPANASHQVGVGGFVINAENEVLVVQEKHFAPSFSGVWKLPTGFILESEEIFEGAVREVKEETGVDTEFMEVIAFRHAHCVAFDKSDLFFICMLRPLTTRIEIDNTEIQAAKWMPLVEFVDQPCIQNDNMFRKIIDICMARLQNCYCGLSAHHVASTFDGKSSCLYYNVDKDCDLSKS
ncbi:hypothetical protein Taro_029250 [Colocasia esculenta]|uniref:Nudix hydrolase domain-containing protein n=1 Tax=Colocasia esculenta TaxID=4460 RepID=A0A843VQK7_COLES|nr:hypothetical protein [Colocasia esculenta]